MSKFAPPFLKFLVMWDNPDNARDFVYSNCYKVIGNAPNDEVVEDVCSLKTEVSLAILKQELENR